MGYTGVLTDSNSDSMCHRCQHTPDTEGRDAGMTDKITLKYLLTLLTDRQTADEQLADTEQQ